MDDDGHVKKLLTVVLPAYKERQNIEYVIAQLTLADDGHQIDRVIYVDDDSPDGSAEFIKQLPVGGIAVDCIHRIGRQGLRMVSIKQLI